MTKIARWKDTHQALAEISAQLIALGPAGSPDLDGVSSDTLFALGEAAGIVAKVKALLGRDIDQAVRDG
jgi:hypothetical protein